MKQQLMAAYRTASRHFTNVVRNNSKIMDIQEVLVPTEGNKSAVCIIMKSGVYMFQPSKEYHKTKRSFNKPRKHVHITHEQHLKNCNRVMDKLLEIYQQQALERLQKRYSRQLTKEEESLLYARRRESV